MPIIVDYLFLRTYVNIRKYPILLPDIGTIGLQYSDAIN